MQSKEILSAIMATIAYLESVQAVPVAGPEPSSSITMPHFKIGTTVDKVPIGDDGPMKFPDAIVDNIPDFGPNIARAPEEQAREIDGKRAINWAKLGESGLESFVGGAATTTGKDLATEAIDGVESFVSNYARAPEKDTREVDGKRAINWAKLGESGLESFVGGAATGTGSSLATEAIDGVESLVSHIPRAPTGDIDLEKRKFSLGKSSPKVGKTPSSGKTPPSSSSSSSNSNPEEESSSGSSTSSNIIGALGSMGGPLLVNGIENAWQSLESHVPRAPLSAPAKRDVAGAINEAKRDRSLTTVGLKGLSTGALKEVGEDIWDELTGDGTSMKRSTGTADAPMAARSGVWDEVLHYGEEAAPIALALLDDAKRSTETRDAPMAARSGVWDEVLHYGEEAAPIALALLEDE